MGKGRMQRAMGEWKWPANMPIFESCRFAHFMHLYRRFKKLMDMVLRQKAVKTTHRRWPEPLKSIVCPCLIYIRDFKYFVNVLNLTNIIDQPRIEHYSKQ
jgi:hypothetical protein